MATSWALKITQRARWGVTKHVHRYRYHQRWFSTGATSKKYAVLVTGGPPAHIQQFGDYGDMMIEMLSDTTQKDECWQKYYCFDNDFPSNDELQKLSGVVITGSRFDAHGGDEWMCRLRDTIRQLYTQSTESRILGICFGHQIVSNALDGSSGPTDIGWQLGVQQVTLNEEFYKRFPSVSVSSLPILKLHQDQVTKLPSNATVLASSWNVPYEMYNIGDNVLCVQGHPEFDGEYLRQVVAYRNREGIIPDDREEICYHTMTDFDTYSNIKQWNSLLRSWLVR